jgi:hypothetical protein
MRHIPLAVLLCFVALPACGSSAPPAAAPESSASAPPEKAADTPASAREEQPEPATASDQPASSASKPSRTPIETITAAKLAFVINHMGSALNEAAEKKCTSDDPKTKAACMQKQRAAFKADVLQFKKDDKGKLWWIVYQRKGSALTVLSKSTIEFSDEKESSVTVNFVGKDKSTRALFPVKGKFVVTVPNDYSIELDEPKYGKLVYDAKIDIVDQ